MPRPTYVNANVNRANYNSAVPIPWVNAGGSSINGGSWWDSAYTANGSTAWASQSVIDNDTPRYVNFDVTTLFQAIYDNPNHLSAVIVCHNSSGIVQWAMCGNANTALRPTITYDGGSATAITENTAVANGSFGGIPNGSTQATQGDLGTTSYERVILNVPPPATRPTSATLTLYTVAQFGNSVPLIFWLRYPPESAPSSGTAIYEFNSLNRGVGRGIARGIA